MNFAQGSPKEGDEQREELSYFEYIRLAVEIE